MSKLEQLDMSILKRPEFENKRSYENAVWFLEKLNDLVMFHETGYVLFERNKKFIPDLRATFYKPENASDHWEDASEADKTGELQGILIGAAGLIGFTRDLKKGRIYVSKREAMAYLKTITIVHKSNFHKFMDL